MRASQIIVVTPASGEPVTVAEAKAFLRIDYSDEDTLIGGLIAAARDQVEKYTGRRLMRQTLKALYPDWGCFQLPCPPYVANPVITYDLADGTTETWASTEYQVDGIDPARVCLKYGKNWPSVTLRTGLPIAVQFDCGHADASAVPEIYKTAVKIGVQQMHWYGSKDNQSTTQQGNFQNQLDRAFFALIGQPSGEGVAW